MRKVEAQRVDTEHHHQLGLHKHQAELRNQQSEHANQLKLLELSVEELETRLSQAQPFDSSPT